MQLPKRVPLHLAGIPGVKDLNWFSSLKWQETCPNCGRDNLKPHCPHCGSTNINGTVSLIAVRIIGGERMLCMGYTCRRCGMRFDEGDTMQCNAPAYAFKSMAEKRQYDKAQENLTALQDPAQRTELIAKLLRKQEEKDGNTKDGATK